MYQAFGLSRSWGLVCMEPTARAVALVGAETVSRAEIFYGVWKVGRARGRGHFSVLGTIGQRERNRGRHAHAPLLGDAICAPVIPLLDVCNTYKTAHPFITCLERFNRWHTR